MKTWSQNESPRSELEQYDTLDAAIIRFNELRGEAYNNETVNSESDPELPLARLTLGMQNDAGHMAFDLIQVRGGKNYLNADFTCYEQAREDTELQDTITAVSEWCGIDSVLDYQKDAVGNDIAVIMPFENQSSKPMPNTPMDAANDELLQRMKKANYKIKHGKYIAVQPPDCGTFIRLKSLGEFYSETALRNRLKAKTAYENKIAQQIQEAQATGASNLVVLKTMRFYMISFSGGYMPIRKKNPQHILTWENDAELDKLTALNAKINEGATLNSLRADMAEKEEAVRRIEQTRDDCDNSDQDTIMKLNASLLLAEKELHEAADLLTTAEQVLGGTFLQTVADEERNRKESKYVPNGTKPGGNAR